MKIIEIFENTEKKLQYLGADYSKVLNKEKELRREQKQLETEYHFAKDLPTSKLFNKYIENTEDIIDKSDDMRSELSHCFEQIAEAISKQYTPKEEYNEAISQVRDWAIDLVALALEMDKDTISVLLSQKKLTKRRIREILFERKAKLILEDYVERRIDVQKCKVIIAKRLNSNEQWEDKILNDLCKTYYREQMNLEMARKAQRSNEDILPSLEEDEELIDTKQPEKEEPIIDPVRQKPVVQVQKQQQQISKKAKIEEKIKSKKQELEEIAEFAKKSKKKTSLKTDQEESGEEEEDEEEPANEDAGDVYEEGDDDENEDDPYLDNLMGDDDQ